MAAMQIVDLAVGLKLLTNEWLKCLLIFICPMPHIKALNHIKVAPLFCL